MESVGSNESVAMENGSVVMDGNVDEVDFHFEMQQFAMLGVVPPQPRVLLLVSGRPSAAEVLEICLGLTARAVEVKVVCTPDSVRYINRPFLARQYDIYSDADFPEHPGYGTYYHVLVNWATTLVFAPLNAHYLAKVTLGLSDDLFCQVANNWPYLDVVDLDEPEGPVLVAAKPALVFADMELVAFFTRPTTDHLHQLHGMGAHVMPGNVFSPQDIVVDVADQLGLGALRD